MHEGILHRVIALEANKGHLKWKVSDLARAAKVSRPLIYYHFGRTKAEIVDRCLELVAESYFGFGPERRKMLAEGRLTECILETRAMYLANPALAVFYLTWRARPSSLQDKLMLIEKRYQAKLRTAFPHLGKTRALALYGIFHGLITAPFLSEEAILETVGLLNSWLKPG